MAGMYNREEPYFHGRISRGQAEELLINNGRVDGLFLLRESPNYVSQTCSNTSRNYAISICKDKQIFHYSIEIQADNTVKIPDGRMFADPVELIRYHEHNQDGLVTCPTIPLPRTPGQSPQLWPGVTYAEFNKLVMKEEYRESHQGADFQMAMGSDRPRIENHVASILHESQPWYHHDISHDEAEKAISKSGKRDGKYLVRKKDHGDLAISLCYKGSVKHYLIHMDQAGTYAIEKGPKFDNIMDLVGYYHNKADGLLCNLSIPCPRNKHVTRRLTESNIQVPSPPRAPSQRRPSLPNLPPISQLNEPGIPEYHAPPVPENHVLRTPIPHPSVPNIPLPQTPVLQTSVPVPPQGGSVRRHSSSSSESSQKGSSANDRHEKGSIMRRMYKKVVDLLGHPDHVEPEPSTPPPVSDKRASEVDPSVYVNLSFMNLKPEDIYLEYELGRGCFGSVRKGLFKNKGQNIPVAVKTMKKNCFHQNALEVSLMEEARLMAELNHEHIVRLIGVCKTDTIMLLMELAPYGPLLRYLIHKTPTIPCILRLMYQVALGMEYLESKNYVHRDLAARNILLVHETFAKISDFGMSRALKIGEDYYRSEEAGKWPLKWYPPESILYWKFDSKSDVWSYGITLWEAMSYGKKPYKGLTSSQIVHIWEHKDRDSLLRCLAMPANCPRGVYCIMQQCWEFQEQHRPTFREIVRSMSIYR